MSETAPTAAATPSASPARDWTRVFALALIVLTTSVVQPTVLIAVPFLILVGLRGIRGFGLLFAVGFAMLVAVAGPRDGLWYVERGWAVLLGGWFAGLTLWRPAWRFATTSLAAVLGATGSAAALLGLRQGAWGAVDWGVSDRVWSGIQAFLDAARIVRDGQALSPAVVTAFHEAAGAQIAVFPALTGIASMAALGVAWWAYRRLSGVRGPALGPLADYRFNDHLVWIFIAGLVLVLTRGSEPLFRVGTNAVVFMGALYTLRGAAVVLFVSGGLSWFGYALTLMGLVLMAPVVLGAALVIGLGDTWLNVRARISEITA